MPRRLRDALDEINETPRKRAKTTTSSIHYKDILVKAYEYFQHEAMASLDALVPQRHESNLQTRAKRKTESKGDCYLENIRKILD